MKPFAIIAGSTIALIGVLPARAASNTIRNAQLRNTGANLEVVLELQSRQPPRLTTNQRGNNWILEVADTQLALSKEKTFFRASPAPGINAVTILPLDSRTVQVIFTSAQEGISGQVRQTPAGIVISFPIAAAGTQAPVKGRLVPPAVVPVESTATLPQQVPETLITKAVVPPTGDLAIAPINLSGNRIILGTMERIPTLVLKDAPAEDVLSVLAMTVGLNTIFVDNKDPKTPSGQPQTGQQPSVPKVSMDIKNESVENVFNYILQVTELQATRVGNTILIGKELPNSAKGLIVRTVRLNQLKASLPETQIVSSSSSAASISSGGGSVAAGGQSNVTTSQLSRTTMISRRIPVRGAQQLLETLGANGGGMIVRNAAAQPGILRPEGLLDGLQVAADARTNTVTLIGTPDIVEVAINYLKQVDVRTRQVSVNVKIVEVSLDNSENIASSFSFGVGDNFFNVNQGQASGNFGNTNPSLIPPIPSADSPGTPNLFSPPIIDPAALLNPFQFTTQFLLNLRARLQTTKSKILTDPTLVIQEGSSSQVNLTTQVFAGLRTISEAGPGNQPRTISDPREPIDVGVILNIAVEQVDDNGFITLAASPEVSSPGVSISDNTGTLIQQLVNRRRLDTGNIRVRNNQTLILAGIIQETDREIVSKTPLLGDIPLIGSLFRSTSTEKERSEVIVLITPTISE